MIFMFQVQSVTGSSFPLSHVSKHQRHSALGKAVPTESVKFRAPCLKAVKNVISPPHPHPLLSISEHVQHFNNDNQFRGPCLNVVRNVNSPPNSTPC